MGFDDAQDEDLRLMLEGVAVVIADPHQPLLEDTVLDFVELEPGAVQLHLHPRQRRDRAGSPGCRGLRQWRLRRRRLRLPAVAEPPRAIPGDKHELIRRHSRAMVAACRHACGMVHLVGAGPG